jgi:hypothetical protein
MTADYFTMLFPLGFADRPPQLPGGPEVECGRDPGPARCQNRRVRWAERLPCLGPVFRENPCPR